MCIGSTWHLALSHDKEPEQKPVSVNAEMVSLEAAKQARD